MDEFTREVIQSFATSRNKTIFIFLFLYIYAQNLISIIRLYQILA
jgi:hypothetical protein